MNRTIDDIKSVSLKSSIKVLIITCAYLTMMAVFTGLNTTHWILAAFFNIMYFLNSSTRKTILAFSIFIVFAIIYDVMRAYPNYLVNEVDIKGIYNFEKHLFGIISDNQLLTINEYFNIHNNVILDFICGMFYINWISVPIGFAIYLYIKNKNLFINFSLTFLFVNILGFCIYYIHPAAPPWYVAHYGFELKMNIPGSTAGLSRFDDLIHLPLFASIYTKNSNVFASIPSLHSAYPIVVLYFVLKSNIGWGKWLFGLFMAGIWFTAVYTGHHYVTDVILGILCALTGISLYQLLLKKSRWCKTQIKSYTQLIS